jgi:hypothetical protein
MQQSQQLHVHAGNRDDQSLVSSLLRMQPPFTKHH